MTKKELAEHNAKAIARISARRQARLALRAEIENGRKPKVVSATIHVAPTATPELKKAVVEMATAAARSAVVASPASMSMKELRAEAKRLYPQLKGMADAARTELDFLVRNPGRPEDSVEIVAMRKAWRHRWEIRVGAWKAGESPSAQKLRQEQAA